MVSHGFSLLPALAFRAEKKASVGLELVPGAVLTEGSELPWFQETLKHKWSNSAEQDVWLKKKKKKEQKKKLKKCRRMLCTPGGALRACRVQVALYAHASL